MLFKKKLNDEERTWTLKELQEEWNKLDEKREKYKIVKFWWNVQRFTDKTWRFIRYDIKYGVGNFWKWRKVIWQDRDWSYHHLLQIMHFKLVEMEKLQRIHGNSVDHLKYAKEIEDAIDVIQRLIDDNYLLDYEGEEIWERQQADLNELTEILNKKLFGWWD